MAVELDLNEIVAGEDETYELTITEGGAAKDVSNWTFEMKIIQKNGRNVVLSGADIDTSNAANGEVVINLNADSSAKLSDHTHPYKIEAEKGNGKDTVLLYGELPVVVIGNE